MKKTILIITILALLSLTGCIGIFNLSGWIWPGDDSKFMAIVEELDTPQKIGNCMEENFEYELHAFWLPSPYLLWKREKGDCNDFATFGSLIAHYHNYETYLVRIFYDDDTIWKHYLAVYVEGVGLSFTDNQYYNLYLLVSHRFNNIKEIVGYDSLLHNKVWTKYIVYDYWNNFVEEVNNN